MRIKLIQTIFITLLLVTASQCQADDSEILVDHEQNL